MKKFLLAAAAAGVVSVSAAPAIAAPLVETTPSTVSAYGLNYDAPSAHQYRRGYDDDWQRRGYRGDRYYGRGYDYDNRYNDRYDRRAVRGWNGRSWRGDDGRYYCRRDNGTTGLLIGGAAGALAGSEIAGRGDRTVGAIIGGIGGALIGRSIDRSGNDGYRCR